MALKGETVSEDTGYPQICNECQSDDIIIQMVCRHGGEVCLSMTCKACGYNKLLLMEEWQFRYQTGSLKQFPSVSELHSVDINEPLRYMDYCTRTGVPDIRVGINAERPPSYQAPHEVKQ